MKVEDVSAIITLCRDWFPRSDMENEGRPSYNLTLFDTVGDRVTVKIKDAQL